MSDSEAVPEAIEATDATIIPHQLVGRAVIGSGGSPAAEEPVTKLGSTKQPPGLEVGAGSDAPELLLTSPEGQHYCGCGPFHPNFVQIFANKKFFTFLMCLFTLLQGSVVSGLTSVNISTWEKRYSFSSTLAGLLAAMYDATVTVCIIFISYFGGKSHKPRFLGISLIIFSIANFIAASPQFIFGSYDENSANPLDSYEECIRETNSTVDNMDDCTSTDIGAYIILLLSQVLIGVGSSAVYTVAFAYIDEIVYPKYISLHFGVISLFAVIGPAIGFLLGSSLLSLYVDPWNNTDLDPTHPSWVGAWWIGYIIMGAVGLAVSVLFLMFPKWLSDSHLVAKERAKEMAKTMTVEKDDDRGNVISIIKKFLKQIMLLLMNPSFMFTSFAIAMVFVVKDGVVTFGPKYLESMFGLTATAAGLLSGGVGIVGAGTGVAIGAVIVYLWRPKGRQTTMIQLVAVVVCVPFVLLFLIKCPSTNVAGIVVPYPDGAFDGRDSSMCAMNCSCQSSVYEPVCGSDGITYFSPCRAGCLTVHSNNDGTYSFENCTCTGATSGNSIISSNSSFQSATEGICSNNCTTQLALMVILTLIIVTLFLSIDVPIYYYTLRVVADDQRHLALGLESAIYRTFGSIPGPLLFGAIVDLSCVEWDYNCGSRGNCLIYDNDDLSLNAIALCLPFVFVSAMLFFGAMLTYPRSKQPMTVTDDKDNGEGATKPS